MEYTFPDCFCGESRFSRVFFYDKAPRGETRFDVEPGVYRREVMCCKVCNHYVSLHNMGIEKIYDGDYVDSTYDGENGIQSAFERIVSLPFGKSDNEQRIERFISFAGTHFSPEKLASKPCVLDVGSGLCIFLFRLKERGFVCTALDPDRRAIKISSEKRGVKGVCKDFMEAKDLGRFDVITFNKVLEHVKNPVAMLERSKNFLKTGGYVYVEVPDGEAAEAEGPQREEFFIEHHHVFSAVSTILLAKCAGFTVNTLERIREPSMKFTLRAFLETSDKPT